MSQITFTLIFHYSRVKGDFNLQRVWCISEAWTMFGQFVVLRGGGAKLDKMTLQ